MSGVAAELPSVEEVDRMSAQRIREVLRSLRQNPVRRSKMVVRCGQRILENKLSMGSEQERYMVCEQIAIASLDCNQIKLAEWFLGELEERFGKNSRRVQRLRGMVREAMGEYAAAQRIYEGILKECETDHYAMLRCCAMLKAQGKQADAIKFLEQRIGTMQTTEAVWRELLNLHIASAHTRSGADYGRAMTCCEELILQDPHNHVWLCTYAELQYSAACDLSRDQQKDALMVSRKYFSQSLVANDARNNTRAVWGLWQTCSKLDGFLNDLNPSEREEQKAVQGWAAERLRTSYAAVETPAAEAAALLVGPGDDTRADE